MSSFKIICVLLLISSTVLMSTGTLVRTAAIKVKRMLKKLVDLHDQGVDLRDKKIGPAHQEELMKHFGREGKRPEIDSGKLKDRYDD